jgi:hypothetical protein
MSEEEEFSLTEEEFLALGSEERLDYISDWMVKMMREITTLAEKVQQQDARRREYGDVIGKVEKVFPVLKQEHVVNDIIKDILKGEINLYGHEREKKNPFRGWVV